MPDLVSNHLNRIVQRAQKADIKANKLKAEAVDAFYAEFTSGDLSRMLTAINEHGHAFEQAAATRILEKINTQQKLSYDEVNEAITLFESSYSNLLRSPQEFSETEVNNV